MSRADELKPMKSSDQGCIYYVEECEGGDYVDAEHALRIIYELEAELRTLKDATFECFAHWEMTEGNIVAGSHMRRLGELTSGDNR